MYILLRLIWCAGLELGGKSSRYLGTKTPFSNKRGISLPNPFIPLEVKRVTSQLSNSASFFFFLLELQSVDLKLLLLIFVFEPLPCT